MRLSLGGVGLFSVVIVAGLLPVVSGGVLSGLAVLDILGCANCSGFGFAGIAGFLPVIAVGIAGSWVAEFADLLPIVAVGIADILSESGFSALKD